MIDPSKFSSNPEEFERQAKAHYTTLTDPDERTDFLIKVVVETAMRYVFGVADQQERLNRLQRVRDAHLAIMTDPVDQYPDDEDDFAMMRALLEAEFEQRELTEKHWQLWQKRHGH
jgi:hypothetical protein